jgi:hypothetical protein
LQIIELNFALVTRRTRHRHNAEPTTALMDGRSSTVKANGPR